MSEYQAGYAQANNDLRLRNLETLYGELKAEHEEMSKQLEHLVGLVEGSTEEEKPQANQAKRK
jgi:hypothetical protein